MKEVQTVKVEGTSFIRDIKSMGLSNLDLKEKNDYYSKVRLLKSQKDEINNLKDEMSSIKEDVIEIKQILRQLLGKG